MLLKLRHRLSIYRNSIAPVASLVDFLLWTLRSGLPLRGIKFWIITGLLILGVLVSILYSAIALPVLMLTMIFGILVLLMLILSYMRTMLSSNYSLLEQRSEQISSQVSQIKNIDPTFMPGTILRKSSSELSEEALVVSAISEIMQSDVIEAFAKGHDDLQADVISLQKKLELVDEFSLELSELRAEISKLSRRTERHLKLETNTISYLLSQIESLGNGFSTRSVKTTKRRSTRKSST